MDEIKILLDSDSIMKYKLNDDVHIWPLVRYMVMSDLNGINEEMQNKSKIFSIKKVFNLLKNFFKIRVQKADIIFITSTLSNTKIDGKYKNILDDYYAEVFPDKSYIYEYLAPETFDTVSTRKNERTSTLPSYMDVVIVLCSKFVKNKKNKNIESFLIYLKSIGIEKSLIDRVETRLYRYQRELKIRQKVYRLFLKYTQPKLLFINCAFYGEKNAVFIQEAKKLGIAVAEIQHGSIPTTHPAYNFTLESIDYNQYLPDYLLTFGDYYNSIQTNIKKISVGHPHLDWKKQNLKYEKSIENSYLFISQWTILDELIDLAVDLANKCLECSINYRLHPLDNLTKEQKEKLAMKNIIITGASSGKDIYSEFAVYENIVGCYSTAVLEANSFDKKIYIMKHQFSLENGFDKFGILVENGDDILSDKTLNQVTQNIFSDGFIDRYKNFINTLEII